MALRPHDGTPYPETDRRSTSARRRVRRGLIVIATIASLVVPAGGALADTQRLPDAACNAGTLGTGIKGPVPHHHDFDNDGVTGCYPQSGPPQPAEQVTGHSRSRFPGARATARHETSTVVRHSAVALRSGTSPTSAT